METDKISIVIEPCTHCGGEMEVARVWVEDAGKTGVIECVCRNCAANVIVETTIQEGDA